jgi:hypothetical protein
MNRFVLLILAATISSFFQVGAENSFIENSVITEFVVFKAKDPSKGIEVARAIIEDIKAFNNGIIAAEVYQSVNDPNTIAQRITWKSLEKAKDAFAAFDTFPSASNFAEESESIIFFDHFKLIKKD